MTTTATTNINTSPARGGSCSLLARLRAQRYTTRVVLEGALTLARVYLRSPRRGPFILNHLVTVRCNLSCPFCYVSGPEQREFNSEHFPKRDEMTTEEMCNFYRQLVAADFKIAVIVGGEPLLRPDLDQMLAVLSNNIYASVFTNGMLLAERAELVRKAPSIFVSLDAPDAHHNDLRDRSGCFDRAMAGIEVMRSRYPKVNVGLNMTVTGQNVHRVREMITFSRREKLPIAFQPPTYEGQFALEERPSTASEVRVPRADLVADAFRAIRDAAERQPIIGSRSFFEQVVEDRRTYACHYPSYVLGPVMPNGNVVACTTHETMANLRDTSVAEILRSAAYKANAAAGPTCTVGCRDWGIYDISAIRNREFGAADLRRYFRTFVTRRVPSPAAGSGCFSDHAIG